MLFVLFTAMLMDETVVVKLNNWFFKQESKLKVSFGSEFPLKDIQPNARSSTNWRDKSQML